MCFVRIITFQGVFAMFAADSSRLRPKHDQLWQKSALGLIYLESIICVIASR